MKFSGSSEVPLPGDRRQLRYTLSFRHLHSSNVRVDGRNHEALAQLLSDESPAVRRAGALALARLGSDAAADALVNAYRADDGKDAFLTDGYLRGIERLGKPGVAALRRAGRVGADQADLDKVAAAFATFRTRPAADALPAMLANPHLTAEWRAELVRSFTNYLFDPPLPMDPMATYLTAHTDEPAVAIAGLEVLAATGNLSDPKSIAWAVGLLDSAGRRHPAGRAAGGRGGPADRRQPEAHEDARGLEAAGRGAQRRPEGAAGHRRDRGGQDAGRSARPIRAGRC